MFKILGHKIQQLETLGLKFLQVMIHAICILEKDYFEIFE